MINRRYLNFVRYFLPFWPALIGGLGGFLLGYMILSSGFGMRPISLDKETPRPLCIEKSKSKLSFDEAIDELQKSNLKLATALFNETRLLCWIMHEPKRADHRSAIMETWGKRCQLILFMVGRKDMQAIESSQTDPKSILINTRRQIGPNAFMVYLDMDKDHYDNLWSKTRLSFIHIYQHFRTAYDWVLKVDDDSYVIVENLRLFLRGKKPEDPFYYGCEYKDYASGGPGYVLSRPNVEKFVHQLKHGQDDDCSLRSNSNQAEDSLIAQCLRRLGIRHADTRDSHGRFRFSPFNPENTINHETLPSKYHWFWASSAHKMANGFECCSDLAISFHYISPTMIRVMEYLTYYAHPFSSREIWNRIYTNTTH